jgi:hypothetical protein
MKRFAPVALHLVALSLVACAGAERDDAQEDDPPVAEASEALQSVTSFSVVIASDPQFWWSIDDIVGDDATALGWSESTMETFGYQTNRAQVSAINKLVNGTSVISGFAKPSFVIVNGDLTEYARTVQRDAYVAEYPNKMSVTVFPGLGNHDYGDNVHDGCRPSADEVAAASAACLGGDCTAVNQMTTEGANWCGNESRRWMQSWITAHRGGLNSFDPGSLAYSWSKNGIRFVELHNYPAYAEPDFEISDSLGYLRNELAIAAAKGERVAVNLHDFRDWDGTYEAKDNQLVGVLNGFEYNIVGIFSGHHHDQAGFQSDVVVNGVHIPWFRSGSGTWNHALLVQFDATSMKVVAVNTAGGTPMAVTSDEVITSSYNAGYTFHATAPHTSNYPVNPCPAGKQPAYVGGLCLTPTWQRIVTGMAEGAAEADDQVGKALAKGDFNGDGIADLAIGAPSEDVGSTVDAGAVNIVYGSRTGLTVAGNAMWHLASTGVPGDPGAGDNFGRALAAGDFNGDGYCDLAVGAPGKSVTGHGGAGEVFVLFGSAAGLTASGAQEWNQDSAYVQGVPESGDAFGWSLAAGDFNGDGKADLAIGIPYEDLPAGVDGGSVSVFTGTAGGLSAVGDPCFDQNTPGVEGGVENYDKFGWSLAAGDFNGDGKADLAIGVPYEDLYGYDDGGEVHVFTGTAGGLSPYGDPGFDQNSSGVQGGVETGDKFGWALAAGDFNGDGKADLAIGVPGEDLAGGTDGGAVHIFQGGASGLTTWFDPGFDQDYPGIPGSVESGDQFGYALAAGDFNGDGKADVAIGVPGEDLTYGGNNNDGLVNVLYGTSGEPTGDMSQEWTQTW